MSWDEANSSESGNGGGEPNSMAMAMSTEGGWEYLMEHCDDSSTVGRGYLDSTSGREDKYAFSRASGVSSPLDWASSIASPLSTIVGDYGSSSVGGIAVTGGSSSKHQFNSFNSPTTDQQRNHNHVIGNTRACITTAHSANNTHQMSNHYNSNELPSLRGDRDRDGGNSSSSAQIPSGSDVHIASYLSVHGVPIVTGGSPTTSVATTTTPDSNKRSHGHAVASVSGVGGGGGGGGGESSSHTCTNSPKSVHEGCSSIGSQHSSDKELCEDDADFLGLGSSSEAPARKKRVPIPDERKDAKYWERRKKNNMAAKRSREMRRKKVDVELRSARKAIQENEKLKQEIEVLKTEVNSLRRLLQDANTTLSLWIRARQVSEPNAQLPPMLRGPNISFVNFPVSTASV